MPRYAMVNDASGIVVNMIMWDGSVESWTPPAGHTMIMDTENKIGIGFTRNAISNTFMPPPVGGPGTRKADPAP
jgi:hypothetical protein